MNIIDPILFQCKWQPLGLALCAPGTIFNSVTYGRLERFIHNVSRNARKHGLARGNVVALFIKDPILHSAVILGLTNMGVVTVSARELALPKELRVDAILVDSSYPSHKQPGAILVDVNWVKGDGHGNGVARADVSPEDACRIVLTSGTTSSSKAVVRSNKNVLMRLGRRPATYGNRFPTCSRIFLDIGLATGSGFAYLIYTLSRGGTLFMRGGSGMESLEALTANRVQAMVASPKTLAEVADLCDEVPAFAATFEIVISTGAMLTKALAERVRARLCPHVVSVYGSTETSNIAAAPASVIAKIENAVGYIAPDVVVDIVDASGKKLPDGKEGLVRVRSDCLVDGYMGDLEETQLRFREDGFYSGDIGAVMPNGILLITGREGTSINTGGDKVNPERVEAALASYGPVRDAAAFGITNRLGIQRLASAVHWRGEPDLSGLQKHLQQHLPPSMIPKSFLAVDAIPRNSSGKIDRKRLKEIAARGVEE